MNLTLPVVTAAALIDSLNPCAISVLLLTIGFLFSLNVSRRRLLTITGLYITGIFITYIFIGLGILSALTLFGIPRAITKIGAMVLVVFSLISLAETLVPKFPLKLAIPGFIKPRLGQLMYQATAPSALLMGVLVGLFEFPCTGGPYLMILSLLHDQATSYLGMFYLLYYNLIFVSPLILILVTASHPAVIHRLASWRSRNSRSFHLAIAAATLILGVVIFLLS